MSNYLGKTTIFRVFFIVLLVFSILAYATNGFTSRPVPDLDLEHNFERADYVAVVSKVNSIADEQREGFSFTKCEVHLVLKDDSEDAQQSSPRIIRILHRTKGDGKGGGSSRMVFDIDGIKDAWSLVFLCWSKTEDAFLPLTGQDDAAYSQFIMLRPRDPLPH